MRRRSKGNKKGAGNRPVRVSNMQITINTDILNNDKILQETRIDGCYKSTTRLIISTQEEQTRQALIKIGWTPPPEKQKD
jgi:hypothetical protein